MWIQRLNTIKMSVLPNLICRFNSIPIKISAHYFVDNKSVSKVYMERQKPRIPKTILKKNQVRGLIPNFKTYCKTMAIKTVWYW